MVGLRTRGRWLEKENHGVLGRCWSLKIKKYLKLNIFTAIKNHWRKFKRLYFGYRSILSKKSKER